MDDENESDHFEVGISVLSPLLGNAQINETKQCRLVLTETCVTIEPAVDQLADNEVQTSTSKL